MMNITVAFGLSVVEFVGFRIDTYHEVSVNRWEWSSSLIPHQSSERPVYNVETSSGL